ncbi:uncharacterized protein METZ01_LOCUS105080, partial [marine metagenome]
FNVNFIGCNEESELYLRNDVKAFD